MAENKKSNHLTPATDSTAFPTAKAKAVRLTELMIGVIAQIDAIQKCGITGCDKITRTKIWEMAQKTDNGRLSAIYDRELKKAKEKLFGKGQGDISDAITGFDEFDAI